MYGAFCSTARCSDPTGTPHSLQREGPADPRLGRWYTPTVSVYDTRRNDSPVGVLAAGVMIGRSVRAGQF